MAAEHDDSSGVCRHCNELWLAKLDALSAGALQTYQRIAVLAAFFDQPNCLGTSQSLRQAIEILDEEACELRLMRPDIYNGEAAALDQLEREISAINRQQTENLGG